MKQVSPYLNFAGNTEEALHFYKTVFGGELGILRFRDFGENTMNIPENELSKVAHAHLPLGQNNMMMATDTLASLGQHLTIGNNFYIYIETDSVDETEQLFNALSNGGDVEMPLQQTEWAERHGICKDKFGIQWMLNYTGDVRFSGDSAA
jgi:PhnB protein